MTEAEKQEIVGLVMTQISSQAVDFDIATEQPQANDLLTAVRQTSSGAYVGVTIKWDDVARIATELANQAATRAEQAKTNVENMKSSVEQIVTDFNALAEEKKQEVQGVYQSDLNELKGDLVNVSDKVFITEQIYSINQSITGTVAFNVNFETEEIYEIHVNSAMQSNEMIQMWTALYPMASTIIDGIEATKTIPSGYVWRFKSSSKADRFVLYCGTANNADISIYHIKSNLDKLDNKIEEVKEKTLLIDNEFKNILHNDFKTQNDWYSLSNATISENGLIMNANSYGYNVRSLKFDNFIMTATFKVVNASSVFGLITKGGWESKYIVDGVNSKINLYTNGSDTTPIETISMSSALVVNRFYKLTLYRNGWEYRITLVRCENSEKLADYTFYNYDNSTERRFTRCNGQFGVACVSGSVICSNFDLLINHKECKCLILGDSLTEGDQVSNTDRWAYKIKNEYFRGDAIISGGGGENTTGIKSSFNSYNILGLKYDYVIILAGMNNRAEGYTQRYKDDMDEIISTVVSNGAVPIVCINPIPSALDSYIHEQRAYAVSKGWNIVRLDLAFSSSASHVASLFNDDGIHPNKAGHQKIFETVQKYLDDICITN